MRCLPVPRDINPSSHPDAIMRLEMIEKSLQCPHPAWTAQQSAMHADTHHRRALCAFRIEHIEAIAQILEKFVVTDKLERLSTP